MTTAMLAVHPENEIIHARTMMMSMPPQQPCPHHHNVHAASASTPLSIHARTMTMSMNHTFWAS